MVDIKQEQYKHLENICNIQQKYINNKIKTKKYLEELDDENKRYLSIIKHQNKRIKHEIAVNKLLRDVKDILNESLGENK